MPSPSVAFNHGVASGDPYSNSVILWTRITPPQGYNEQVDGSWQASRSPGFEPGSIVDSGTFSTSASRDWTVKVEADGLTADTTYYYRFRVGDGESIVGQTKTLPVDSGAVRLAVFSCANFPAADTFAAYGRAAAINAVNPYDALVHLGDYIYEYGLGGYGAAEGAATDRGFLPNREIVSLDDYRQRYAQYHTDQNLQALRAAAPLIAIWDDHETANDSWSGGAENHQPRTEGDWIERRDAALKAYYEWLPIREPLLRQGVDQGDATTPLSQGYRSFDFGGVLDLHVLETRLTARDEQLEYPDAAAVQARIGAILSNPTELVAYAGKLGLTPPTTQQEFPAFGAAIAPAVTQELVIATVQQAWGDPTRDLIGDTQLAWLQQQLTSSTATWQVLGQGVLMQSMAVPAELLLNAGDPTLLDKYAAPLQKLATGTPFADLSAAEKALFAEAGKIPYNLDAWDGYGVERETILQTALAGNKRLISLAGDTHNAWAGVLDTMTSAGTKPAGTAAGVEFATPGVTSPGLEKYLPGADAYIRAKYPAVDGLDGLFSGYVSGLKYADLNRRGFLDLTVSKEEAIGSFQFLDGLNSFSGLPQWASETVVAGSDLSLSITPQATSQINWQPGWSELDLVFGLATDRAGGQTLLNPAAFATLPRASVQLADVTVLGSEAGDRIFAGVGSLVDGAGGDDELFNIDSQGDNLLVGGTGTDSFFLRAVNDWVIGGDLLSNAPALGLTPFTALVDQERDTFLIDSSNPGSTGALKIRDFELGVDVLLVDGVATEGEWSAVVQQLQSLQIHVNAAPQLRTSVVLLSLEPGVEVNFDLASLSTDPDGNPLQLVKLEGPTWIETSGSIIKVAAPSGLNDAQLSGLSLSLAFSDGQALMPLATQLILNGRDPSLTVTNEDIPLVIASANLLADHNLEGTPVVTAVAGAINGTVALADGTITFTPAANYSGPASFIYTVTSGSVTESATVNLNVTPFNDGPSAVKSGNTGTASEDNAITDTLIVTDPDGLASQPFSLTAQPSNGTASIDAATGAWSYTPKPDYNGNDSFNVTVTDRQGFTSTQRINLIVSAVADIANDTATTAEDTPLVIPAADLLTNDSFSFQGTPVVTAVGDAVNGTVALADGTIAFTPAANYSGPASFIYTVTSGSVTESATVNLNITPVNDAPQGRVSVAGGMAEGRTLQAVVGSIVDVDGVPTSLNFRFQWEESSDDGQNWLPIANATYDKFTLGNSQVGKRVGVVVNYIDAYGTAESVYSYREGNVIDLPAKVINVNDRPGGSLSITGNATQGQTLILNDQVTDTDGLIGVTKLYQWRADGADIASATANELVLTQELVGKTISAVMRYTDLGGTAERVLSANVVGPVDNSNDVTTGEVSISGTPAQGQTLSASNTLGDLDGLGAVSYQWKAGSVVVGTGSTLTLTQAHVGQTITVTASYIDGFNEPETVTSAATAPVANINDAPSGGVVISGTAGEGRTITASNTLADADGLGAISYQWISGSDVVGTGSTLDLTQADVGKTITVEASYTDLGGFAEKVLAVPTAPVFSASSQPQSGTLDIRKGGDPATSLQQGDALTAFRNAIVDNEGVTESTVEFRWFADGVTIPGATSSTLTLAQDQVGNAISVAMRYIDGQGTASGISSAALGPVANINDVPTGVVSISGTPAQGQTLSASNTLGDLDGLGAVSYQWKAGSDDVGTGSTLTLTQADVGNTITVTASYTDGFNKLETVTSAATAPVANINDAPTGAIGLQGYLSVGQSITANTSKIADADGIGAFTLQWQSSPNGRADSWSDISGANASTFVLGVDQAGERVRLKLTYTDGQGTPETVISAPTSPVLGSLAERRAVEYFNTDIASYSWERSNNNGVSWQPVAGASEATLKTTDDMGGQRVRVVVNGIPVLGNGLSVVPVDNGVGKLDPISSDSGDGFVTGATLRVKPPFADPDGIDANGAILYQWQRFTQGQWQDIGGATKPDYRTSAADQGAALRVKVDYTDTQDFKATLYTDLVRVTEAPPPPATGTFDAVAGDDVLTAIERNETNGVVLSGTITSADTQITLTIGNKVRVPVATTTNGITGWEYTLKTTDYAVLVEGENVLSATLTSGAASNTGTATLTRTVFIPQGVLEQSSVNSAVDPTQPKGLAADVQAKAESIKASLPEEIKNLDFNAPNVAALPFGDSEVFNQAGDAKPGDFGAIQAAGDAQIGGVEVLARDNSDEASSSFMIPLADGTEHKTSLSNSGTSFQPVADPLSMTVSGVQPGSTTTVDFLLPANVSRFLPSDLRQATYYKFNYDLLVFANYLGASNNPLYEYILADSDNNGKRDNGELVTLRLRLTDGDQWDGDQIANGIIVDPGTLGFNVNAKPSGTDKTIRVDEDGSHTFSASDFGFSDPNNTPANTLLAVKITTLPAAGTLKLENAAVTAGESIAMADLTKLVYTPPANANGTGYAAFTFQVQDDGGTAEGGEDLDASANTITFNITAVNDSPTGAVLINGSATEGQTLSATSTLADADGLGTLSYQWLADGIPIAGASNNAYTLNKSSIGKALSVVVSYTDKEGTQESVASAPTALVTPASLPKDNQQERERTIDGNVIDANRDGVADSLQDNVVARPLLGSGDQASDYIAVVSPAGVRLEEVKATAVNSSTQSITVSLPSGETINAALPDGITNKFSNVVLSFNAVLGAPGSSSIITLYASETVLSETNAYVRFNYKTKRFEDFVDANGRPLYRFIDADNNGRKDSVELTLTDGDPSWDGDGTANGTVVDPGFLAAGEIEIIGNKKANILRGNLLANSMHGRSGNDILEGGLGNDRLDGGNGNDRLFGGEGDDIILGGNGRDYLFGENGNDTLYGNMGNDWLNGGAGDDIIYGGRGKDRFIVSTGGDQIMDFRKNQGDKIIINSSEFHRYELMQESKNTIVNLYGLSDQLLGQTVVHNTTTRQIMRAIISDL